MGHAALDRGGARRPERRSHSTASLSLRTRLPSRDGRGRGRTAAKMARGRCLWLGERDDQVPPEVAKGREHGWRRPPPVAVYSPFKDMLIVAKDAPPQSRSFREAQVPRFGESILMGLCEAAIALLWRIPTVIELGSPVYIVGDINGNVFDLVRILARFSSFPTTRHVSLGTYIARGLFSVQCVALLLLPCPSNVVLFRGLREFGEASAEFGFEDEFGPRGLRPASSLSRDFHEVFAHLPLACLVDGEILCVHGVVRGHVQRVAQIVGVRRSLHTSDDPVVAELVCARGGGCGAGAWAFLSMNGVRTIAHGHDRVAKGAAEHGPRDRVLLVVELRRSHEPRRARVRQRGARDPRNDKRARAPPEQGDRSVGGLPRPLQN